MTSAFLYDYSKLCFDVKSLGLRWHYGDQSGRADADKTADDYDGLDYKIKKMMRRKCEIFQDWRSK